MSSDDLPFVEEFSHGSVAYQDACALRHTFLRLPLGLELTAADKADDATQLHFGLFSCEGGNQENEKGKRLLIGGCIGKLLENENDKTIQFRQVVIHEAWRSQGLGYKLMLETEELLAQRGYKRFILYAVHPCGTAENITLDECECWKIGNIHQNPELLKGATK